MLCPPMLRSFRRLIPFMEPIMGLSSMGPRTVRRTARACSFTISWPKDRSNTPPWAGSPNYSLFASSSPVYSMGKVVVSPFSAAFTRQPRPPRVLRMTASATIHGSKTKDHGMALLPRKIIRQAPAAVNRIQAEFRAAGTVICSGAQQPLFVLFPPPDEQQRLSGILGENA